MERNVTGLIGSQKKPVVLLTTVIFDENDSFIHYKII